MRNYQPALRALLACESGLSEPEIGLEDDKWQNLHGARLQKQMQNALMQNDSFGHFHLISSVSRTERPLIYDYIYPPPPFPSRQYIRGKFFSCPFHSKSAPRNRCPPPQLFDAPYAPDEGTFHGSRIPYTYFIFYSRYLNFQVVFKF